MAYGTGAVKVTPAHDPNDYACGKRNGLEIINMLNEDGTLNENAGEFKVILFLFCFVCFFPAN
jgi:valyl-tRNA synthetase